MSAKKAKIKVLLADDHPVVLKGLRACLEGQERLRIVGEAADGEEALRKTWELRPAVVLLGINKPLMDSLAVTLALRKGLPKVKVLILSVNCGGEFISQIIQLGAHGYVSKTASPEELTRAIESVHAGKKFFGPEMARAGHLFAQLTDRERKVLALIAKERTSTEIAKELGVGVITVEVCRAKIMRRLDIHSVAGLSRFAIGNGLVSIEGAE